MLILNPCCCRRAFISLGTTKKKSVLTYIHSLCFSDQTRKTPVACCCYSSYNFHLSIYLSIYLFIYLLIYLFIYLFINSAIFSISCNIDLKAVAISNTYLKFNPLSLITVEQLFGHPCASIKMLFLFYF